MATPFLGGRFQAIGTDGQPLSGAKVYTYSAGTLTPQATYTDQGGGTPNANPVFCDAAGLAYIGLGTAAYKFRTYTSADVFVREDDNIRDPLGHLAGTAAADGDAVVVVKKTTTGSVATTQHEVNERVICTFDYMSAAQIADVIAGGFTLDCRAAVQAAVTAAVTGGVKKIRSPGKGYLINGVASSDTVNNGILFPYSQVNYDPSHQILFEGDGMGTVFRCGSTGMVMFRASRNHVLIRDLSIDGNSLSNTWGIGAVPEDMTSTTAVVGNSNLTVENVGRMNLTEGLVYMPGAHDAGSDSGAFYHTVRGGFSNNNTRHIYTKKNADWATNPNRPTRCNFFDQALLRGNVGYYLEVGSEINIHGGHEELIDDGTSPLATPTARYVSADCTNVNFFGGYSESCSASFDGGANNVNSWGYLPASGATTDWRTYANAWADGIDDSSSWTPVLASSGGGAEGASTSTGKLTKHGKIVFFTAQVSVAKGTLGAGTLSVTGLPFVTDTAWTGAGLQGMAVVSWSGITFSANVFTMDAYISGATLNLRKLHAAGAGPAGLTLAECADPVVFTIQGFYKAA